MFFPNHLLKKNTVTYIIKHQYSAINKCTKEEEDGPQVQGRFIGVLWQQIKSDLSLKSKIYLNKVIKAQKISNQNKEDII